jgi:iron(III) transport system permease protein
MRTAARFIPGGLASLSVVLVCGVPIAYALLDLVRADAMTALEPRMLRLAANSLAVAGGSALVACVLGVPIGFALGDLRAWSERVLACTVAVPSLMPPYVTALAWIELTGARGIAAQTARGPLALLYSPAGAAWILGTSCLAIPAAAVVLAARSGALSGVDPARHARAPLPVLRRIVWPAVRPYVIAAGTLVFVFSLADFAVPSLLQVAVYPVEVHARFAAYYDTAGALVAAAPVVVAGLVLFAALAWYLRRVPRPLGERSAADAMAGLPAALRRAFFWASCGVLLVTALLPLVAVIHRAESIAALSAAWATAGPELRASSLVGAASATLATAIAFVLFQSSQRAYLFVPAVAMAALTFLMPGPAVAVALIGAWNHAGWRATVYDGPQVLVLACTARLLMVALIVLAAARASRPREWEEAARVSGVDAWRRHLWIALPASAPALVAAWGIVLVLSSREADAGALVAPPGFTTIAVRLLALMHYGPSSTVAGLALLLVSLTIGAALLVAGTLWASRRWLYGSIARP